MGSLRFPPKRICPPLTPHPLLPLSLSPLKTKVLALRDEFDSFLATYEKTLHYAHSAKEYVYRLGVFAANVAAAKARQANDGGSAVHGVTKFFDLTPSEFASAYLGRPITKDHIESRRRSMRDAGAVLPDLPTDDLPLNVDWRERGAVTAVKNQGFCGSCWTFSTTGAVEGANFLATGNLTSLSEQQLVDCAHTCDPDGPDAGDSGCDGGLPINAMAYVQKRGLDLEANYPYVAKAGKCKSEKDGPPAATVADFALVSTDESQIAAALVKHGPLSIGIDAAWMQSYKGGVSCPFICNKERLDHGVLIVGYGDGEYAPLRLHNEPFWIVKNSWGPDWGEDGYYKICKDKGSCGLNNMVVAAMA